MKLNKLLKQGKIDAAAQFIFELYSEAPAKFKKTLLLSDNLPEPTAMDFNLKYLDNLLQAFQSAGLKLMANNVNISIYAKEFKEICGVIKIIGQNMISNKEKLANNSFSDYFLSEQIQMLCIYIEDQNRLSQKQNFSISNKRFLTGMENAVASLNVNDTTGVKISEADRSESLIDIAENLFRFSYYMKENEIETSTVFDHNDISPYNIGSLEEIMHLSFQRNMLVNLWGKFKYRNWNINKVIRNNDEIYAFTPENKTNDLKEHIAVNRYSYRDFISYSKKLSKHIIENRKAVEYIKDIAKKNEFTATEFVFSLKEKDFSQSNVVFRNALDSYLANLDSIYKELNYNGVQFPDLIKGFEYLFTIAMIYRETVLKDFNENEKSHDKVLSPIIDKDNLINQFCDLYKVDLTKGKKIFEMFSFSPKPLLDVFSQPLIYVGSNRVVFCPTLILQMNVRRIIEGLASKFKIDIANKGIKFEENIRNVLSCNPFIKVNTNTIRFTAYDGKQVEFDFLGLFDDHLLLIECKHEKAPFDDKDKKQSLDIIDYGIEQVNRREKVINEDWKLIRERCSFELPLSPPENIIKLLCTNIYDFSTIVRNNVEIIDSSSLIKFFIAPEIKKVAIGDTVEEEIYDSLWKGDAPSIEDFKSFLRCPVAVAPFIDCYKPVFKPLMKIKEEDFNINFFDYSLIKNPFESLDKNAEESPASKPSKKIRRNDLCICGSQKKYKRCCINKEKR
jgi:SEC-C motif